MLMKREYLENCPQERSYLAKNSSFLEEFNTPCIMRKLYAILICLSPMLLAAQEEGYRMHSYAEEGVKAPNVHYLGEAWLHRVIEDAPELGYHLTRATFKANSTLDWHQHSEPQVLIVVEGMGYYQERGKDPVLIQEGDVVQCDPNTEHWHASSKEHDVTYLAIYSGETTWTEALTREDYDAVADLLTTEK